VLYVGPTNSGKTYHALNELAERESGVYLAPLRLLALEGQEELEKRGRPTTFLTGEERDIREGATFYSSTIEMLNFDRAVDAVVVDEVQLLSDPERGWAWSAAIVGAPAKRVIMTGSPDAVPLVGQLAEYLGEPLHVQTLERFTPLAVHEEVDDLDRVEPGTAIVCFSRRDVLGLKQYLEHRHRVSVIYGNLSPQVRREEARRFRSGETKVLVATDAIALGLNLPIKTVIFYTTWKWNGREDVRLTPSEVRQIGGRAGRFGKHDAGFVGALSYADLEYVREAFEEPIVALPSRAQVRPSLQHVTTMSEVLGARSLARLLDLFRRRIRFDASLLVASVPDDMLELASLADAAGMPLEDRFTFACAPVDTRNAFIMRNYPLWMNSFAHGRVSRVERLQSRYEHSTGEADPEAFYHAEVLVKTLTVYSWLAYRNPDLFPDLEECDRQRGVLNRYIERTLRKKGRMRRCASCGNALPPLSQYSICDSCFRSRKRR
jgi:ATP-dependent RNA helicase SUPV3L1/SUV3